MPIKSEKDLASQLRKLADRIEGDDFGTVRRGGFDFDKVRRALRPIMSALWLTGSDFAKANTKNTPKADRKKRSDLPV